MLLHDCLIEDDSNPYNIRTREMLELFTDVGFGLGIGNVVWPEGNARIYLKSYFDLSKEYGNPYDDKPRDVKSISIESDGTVLQGNIYRNSIINILENYRP